MTIKLIVGLANPGKGYITTRHNAGSWYVELLAKHYQQTLQIENKFYGYTGKLTLCGHNVHLLVPTTFMNLSGKAVIAISNFYHISPEEILIAHDELSLPPGKLKLKFGYNHGGHKGLKDIFSSFGQKNKFYRLNIGIGHPGQKSEVVCFVLDTPTEQERQLIDDAINRAILCTETLINKGIVEAITCIHT